MGFRGKFQRRTRLVWKMLLILLLTFSLLVPAALAGKAVQTPGVPDKGWGMGHTAAPSGVVSVSQPLAAKAGAAMLAKGGNAIDAAAAIQFALNVEEPMMTGIGGGAFIMIYSAKHKKVFVIDSRERAPFKATPDQFLNPDGSEMDFYVAQSHGIAVGVPGTLLGTATALKKFGTMKLAEVMQPAIKMAREGITISEDFGQWLSDDYQWKLEKTPGKAYTFFDSNGNLLKTGDLLVQKDLANTLQMIAEHGTGIFYHGPIAKAVADIVKAREGPMEAADIQTYDVKWRTAVEGKYRGWDIVSMPPPSSGGLTMIQMLMMMERFDIGEMGHNSADALHVMMEAMHLAFADRGAYMGDADFVEIPIEGLLNPDYVATRSALIKMDTTNESPPPGDPWAYEGVACISSPKHASGREGRHTTHFVVADRWGNVVAWTTTIEDVWGSGIMVPGYGFMLNNEMTDFNFTPGGANELQPMKRPRSSMTPTILFKHGKPWMATGSPGGPTIITTAMQVIMNVIDHDMTIQEAVDAPRIFSGWYPWVSWEEGITEDVRKELTTQFSYLFDEDPGPIGSAQSLVIDLQTGRIFGAADPRRDGTVIYVKGRGHNQPMHWK
jgi:gamma-glutamyltranspeptidase / glutathione hydrolase